VSENRAALDEWKSHWPLVLASLVGFSFTSLMPPAIGLFMGPLSLEFGWNRTQLSAGLGVAGILGVVLSPLFGILIDRWGSRRLALVGIVLVSTGVAGFGLANGSFEQWIGLWVFWGVACMFVHSTTWSAAVAGLFSAGRGLALGVTLSGTALTQVIVPPLTNWLIATRGWREAFAWLGFGWGGVAFVLIFLFLFDARDRHRLGMDGEASAAAKAPLRGLTVAEAWRSTQLWRIAISTFLILTVTLAVLIHQFPILVEAGETRERAAWLASLAGVAGIAGKLVAGTLIDRFHARWIGGITFACTAIAYPLLMPRLGNLALIVIAMMINGYAAGTKIQLCGYLTARYAGLRSFGTIFGFMAGLVALASAVGPVVAGLSFDRFGSYAPLLVAGAIISLICGLLIFSLGPYPDWGSDTAVPAESELA
jgi:predicted MFS family arabinose efflux permease